MLKPFSNMVDEAPDKFEPKSIHLYTVSSIQIEAVMREAKNCDGVFASGMFRALELLGLPS